MVQVNKLPSNIVVVKPQIQRLDASMAEGFKSEVKAIVDDGARHLVIDFSEVQFMDSSGLGALVGSLKYLASGGVIEIAAPCDAIQKVLRLTRMNKVFQVRDTVPTS
ncbi:MAG: STAS domain-containing protein [Pseudomonadota bacterium]